MYTKKDLILRAKEYIDKLTQGINPIDNGTIGKNDVVKNERIIICFQYISKWLSEMVIDYENALSISNDEMKSIEEHLSANVDNQEIEECEKKSCDNCKNYISGLCSGFGPICEDYEKIFTFTQEEVSSWPSIGDATYIKRHNKSRDK